MDFSIESNVKAYFIDTLKDLGWQYLSEKECNELITAQTTLKSHLLTELLSGSIRVKIN